jgi:predicted PurR-regulated permease PerM
MSEKSIDPVKFRAAFLLLLVIGISLLFFAMIRPFVTALFLGAIFSGLAQPVYRRLVRWFRGRKALASLTTLILFFIVILGPLGGFMGIVTNQALQVSESVGPWVQQQMGQPDQLDRLIARLPFADALAPYTDQIQQKAAELAGSLGGFVVRSLAAVTRGTVQVLFLLFVMLYAMFFFLKDGVLDKFVSVTRAMVKGTLLIGIVQGALAGAGFAVVGIPAAAFWGTVMAVLSIVPGVGTALVWGPAVIYLFAVGQTGVGIGLLVWCGAVVGTVDNLMRPWLVGRDTQMPDLLILLGTLGGLFLFGAAGVLIGPIVAALFITVWELYGEAFRELLPDVRVRG